MKMLKLDRKIFFRGTLKLVTGMHIGGASLGLSIGGADKVIVRNPVSNLPYAPGSSIKGKLRSLLEKSHNLIRIEQDAKGNWVGPLCKNPAEPLVQLFGFPAEEIPTGDLLVVGPTRLTVRDGELNNIQQIEKSGSTDMYGTELKTEVSIDRLTSAANPRNFERVPAGAEFCFEMIVDLYNVDAGMPEGDEKPFRDMYMEMLREGLRLMQDDYLGGQGSRGYGQVKVILDSVIERTAEDYRAATLEDRPSEYEPLFAEFMTREETVA